jgi:hypothetical protein
MIKGFVNGQTLKVVTAPIVSETVNYLIAEFQFVGDAWNASGLHKFVNFQHNGETMQLELDSENKLVASDVNHFTLASGAWEISVVGIEFGEGGTEENPVPPKVRITTNTAGIVVTKAAAIDGDAFPDYAGALGEQLVGEAVAAKDAAEQARNLAQAARNTAVQAADAAVDARNDAVPAAADAVAARNEAVPAAADAVAARNEAVPAAATATQYAELSREYAEGKKLDNTDVVSGEPGYQNNAKYYSEQAAAAASGAAEDAVAAAAAELQEYTEAASASASAAETAQEKAEDAQTAAETAQGAAEDAQTAAEAATASVSAAASLIQNLDAHRYDAFATETQTDVATFETDIGADGVPVKALSVGMKAVQDSSADPTPDDPLSITGFTTVTLTWNETVKTITLPSISFNDVSQDACYGGSINILTGVLSVEWIKINLWRGNWTRGGASSNYCEATTFHNAKIDVRTDVARAPSIWSASGFIKCNTYRNAASSALYNATADTVIELRQLSGGTTNSALWLRDSAAPTETAPGDTDYYQTMNRYLEGIGAYCIAKLAAPKTYQLDPSTVSTLLGVNTASANSGNLTVTFRVDPTLAYNELKAAIIAAGTT